MRVPTRSAPGGGVITGMISSRPKRFQVRTIYTIADTIADRLVAAEVAEVGECGVRAVEQAQFHRLEGRYIADEFCPSALPRRALPVDETILDHPLPERLVRDWRDIAKPRQRARRRRYRRPSSPARCDRPSSRETRRCASIQRARRSSRSAAKSRTSPWTSAPLWGRLSQHSTENGARPAARRMASASTRKPTAEHGEPGFSRSCRISGCLSTSRPVAGSWQ